MKYIIIEVLNFAGLLLALCSGGVQYLADPGLTGKVKIALCSPNYDKLSEINRDICPSSSCTLVDKVFKFLPTHVHVCSYSVYL